MSWRKEIHLYMFHHFFFKKNLIGNRRNTAHVESILQLGALGKSAGLLQIMLPS